ncbi:MAG: hypothetical protein OQJ84_01500 [Xanthomonadales bacterium]|nr:hypothetical protein [Xanthomonadales bacterium]
MNEGKTSKRGALVRNSVVFQLKLMADGFRDLVLLPVSLIATLVGLLRGGDEPEREFEQTIELGRASEKWINLFGSHEAADDAQAATTIDTIFAKLEETLKQQYFTSGLSTNVKTEIDEALRAAQDQAKQEQEER